MLGTRGTGVVTYANVLAACLSMAGASRATLADTKVHTRRPSRGRLSRWLAATRDGARRASRIALVAAGSERDASWSADDIFREAQVFFNIHGKLLPVAFDQPPKVMHWTYTVPLYVQGAKNLYTVHDLIPVIAPKLSPVAKRRQAKLVRRIAEAADRLVTVSESSRAQIIAYLRCAPEFVVNTYQAVFTPLQRDPQLPLGLCPGSYFLYFGSVERRKNLPRLIEAHRLSAVAAPLIIAGPDGWCFEEVSEALRRNGKAIRLPWQERADLLALIRHARAVCFLSLAEGFGLPVAEAMSLGAPVLTSNRGALAEIAADAALTVNPLDVAGMVAAITRLDHDAGLRARLREAGFQRARMFSLTAYAERLRTLYAEEAASYKPSSPVPIDV